MKYKQLVENIRSKRSFLCVGLDSDIDKIPPFLKKYADPVFEFNRLIIDTTAPYTIAFKPNVAFYESRGAEGWRSLELTTGYIRKNHPDIFIIADAKRGDIGHTAKKYAEAFFKRLEFDAVTVAPYMGIDSVLPFLDYSDKWVILLALTSNEGAEDFQLLRTGKSERLFETVLKAGSTWGSKENLMFVAAANRANMLVVVRDHVPEHFLLVPGVGAQGGSLDEVFKYGKNADCGLIVNLSRTIIYGDNTERFNEAAGQKAREIQQQMEALLKQEFLL
ncbi:MAG TPA: orotidine-5'-phosphate decarboxylase [Bacteroidales bacterium]|nr:orotidine-5'-phosphate decarboxylase [Bacteroidales bacterium]